MHDVVELPLQVAQVGSHAVHRVEELLKLPAKQVEAQL